MDKTCKQFLSNLTSQSTDELPNLKFQKFLEYSDSAENVENKLSKEELMGILLEVFPNSSCNSIFPLEVLDDLFFTNNINSEEKPYMAYFPEGSNVIDFLIGRKPVKMLYYEGMLFLYYVPFRQVFICVNYLRYKTYPFCYDGKLQLCGMLVGDNSYYYAYNKISEKLTLMNEKADSQKILNDLLSIISPECHVDEDNFTYVIPYRIANGNENKIEKYVNTSRAFFKINEELNEELSNVLKKHGIEKLLEKIKVFQYYFASFILIGDVCVFNNDMISKMKFCMKQELTNNSFYGAFKSSKSWMFEK